MKIRTAVVTVLAVACVSFLTNSVQAQDHLFPQYYTQGASQTTAGMYPSPHWVPVHVGHTYNTYQPLMPHEMMYQHCRKYTTYYGNPGDFYGSRDYGVNKTTVRWQASCNHMFHLPGSFPRLFGSHSKKGFAKGCSQGCKGCSQRGCADVGCDSCDYNDGSCGGVYGGGEEIGCGCTAKLTDQTIDR